MAGVVVPAGGQYLNTTSGLTPFLDQLTQDIDKAAQNRDQLRGLAAGGVIPASAAPGQSILARILGVDANGTPAQAAPSQDGTSAPQASPGAPAMGVPPGAPPAAISSLPIATQGRSVAVAPPVPVPVPRPSPYGGLTQNVGPSSAPLPTIASQQGVPTGSGIGALLANREQNYGLPQGYLARTAQIESGGNAGAVSPTGAVGPFQFIKSTAAKYGLSDPTSWVQSADAAGRLASDNAGVLSKALGRPPTAGELYLAHQQGAGGAAALLTNPGAPAGSVVSPKAIAVNGGDPSAPAGQFAAMAMAKFDGQGGAVQEGRSAAGGPPGAQPAAPLNSSIAPPPSLDQIKALVANPATRQMGLQLWQSAIQPRAPIKVGAGETLLSPTTGQPVYSAPVTVKADETVFDPATRQPLYANPGNDNSVAQTGEDQYGNKVFSVFNKRSGVATPVAAPASAAAVANPANAGLNGPDLLATLPPSIAGQVKAIAEGRSPPPNGQALRSPWGRQLSDLVQQYDPTFEAGNAQARNKARIDFESGPTANAITAGNTALQHLSEINDIIPELGNANTGLPGNNLYNSAKNAIGQSAGGAVGVNKFRSAVSDFAGELTKFYRGAGGSEADINRVVSDLNPNLSPEQLRAGLQTQVQLVQGKVNALQDRWRQAMGPSVAPFPIISPTTQAALQKVTGSVVTQGHGAAPASAPTAQAGSGLAAQSAQPPARVSSPAEAQALPPGTAFQTPDGRILVRH